MGKPVVAERGTDEPETELEPAEADELPEAA
jgi:hypothetical protein